MHKQYLDGAGWRLIAMVAMILLAVSGGVFAGNALLGTAGGVLGGAIGIVLGLAEADATVGVLGVSGVFGLVAGVALGAFAGGAEDAIIFGLVLAVVGAVFYKP